MDANELRFLDFIGQRKTKFNIPVYQRNYDWNKDHCKQLLDDILRCGRSKNITSHFIGSIVYIHTDIYSTGKIKDLVIIDGQQRITTVTLIYIVLYKLLKKLGRDDDSEEIFESFLTNKRTEEKLKLRSTQNNHKALEHLINSDEYDSFSEYSKLIENYKYFHSRINEKNIEVIDKGLSKLVFVEISLDRSNDNPQRIFETLNSTGLELSQADLIRNYVLMDLKTDKQELLYKKYWKPIARNARIEKSKSSRVSDFIRDFLTIKNRKIPTKKDVYQEFKASYQLKFEDLKKLLGEIKKYSIYYNRLINPENVKDRKIRKEILDINKLKINVSYPFLLQIYDDYCNEVINGEDFIKVLQIVQSFVWRRFIAGLPTNALNKIFMRLYEDIDKDNYIESLEKSLVKKKSNQRFPRDKEVIENLKTKDMYNIRSRNRTYLFENMENYKNREPVKIKNNPDITIEHIFPQNPSAKWKYDLPDDEYFKLSEEYLNTLANLTLSGNNGQLGNKPFIEKNNLEEKGYKDSRLYLNRYLSKLDKWGVKEIENRFEILSDRFLKIWPYPEVTIEENENYDEVNIFEAEDPTRMKLDYIIFLDQKKKLKNITELYAFLISTLFDLEPKKFFITDLQEQMELTNNPENLRQPKEISETYFIETSLNSKEKFKRLKYLLKTFDLTDELYIKYLK